MKCTITYSCGHEGTVELYGSTKEREYRISSLQEQDCPECMANKRELENAKAADEAKSLNLPSLLGTEKQVAWAEKLRMQFVHNYQNMLSESIRKAKELKMEDSKIQEGIAESEEVFEFVITSKRKASYWIENKSQPFMTIMHAALAEVNANGPTMSSNVQDEPEAIDESTLIPDSRTHDGAVTVSASEQLVSAKYIYDDDFREVIKGLSGYEWSKDRRQWELKITEFTGSSVDRAAELVNALLQRGFAVTAFDEEIRERAVNADFMPACKHWVKHVGSGSYQGWLILSCSRYEDSDLYNSAMTMPGARAGKKGIYIPMERHDLIEDFADIHGLRISQKAQEVIAVYEESKQIRVTPATMPEPVHTDKLAEILNSSDAIIDDLKDD